jgi:DNA-binding transcriptional regulator GbsR (MarR family)
MNARTSMLALVATKPISISEAIRKLPYSSHTIYKAVEELDGSGLVEKRWVGRGVEVRLAPDHRSRVVGRLVLKSIGRGVDPEEALRPDVLTVWRAIQGPLTLDELREGTGFSYFRLRRSLGTLLALGGLEKLSSRPLRVSKVEGHPVGDLMDTLLDDQLPEGTSLTSATAPVNIHYLPPESIERVLLDRPGRGFYIRGADLQVLGDGRTDIYLSAKDEAALEEFFLRLLETPEGVEDLCPQVVASGKLDYHRLVGLVLERGMANEVGVYLAVLGLLGLDVPTWVLDVLREEVSGRPRAFPSWEEPLPKGERREDLEEEWRVDLRLDMGALSHGVRAL